MGIRCFDPKSEPRRRKFLTKKSKSRTRKTDLQRIREREREGGAAELSRRSIGGERE